MAESDAGVLGMRNEATAVMLAKHPCDVHAVAGRVNVKILKPNLHRGAGKPRQCFCPRTLKAIGQRHGEPHLELVLRLIAETKGNAGALQADVVTAVSRVVLSGLVTIDGALFDRFDAIDLAALRTWAAAVRPGCSTGEAMASVLLWQLAHPDQIREAVA